MQGGGSKEAPRNRLLLFNEQRSTLALQHRKAPERGGAAGKTIRKRSASAAARTPIPSPIPAADVGNARAGRAHTPRATISNTRLSLIILRRVRDSCVRDSCARGIAASGIEGSPRSQQNLLTFRVRDKRRPLGRRPLLGLGDTIRRWRVACGSAPHRSHTYASARTSRASDSGVQNEWNQCQSYRELELEIGYSADRPTADHS